MTKKGQQKQVQLEKKSDKSEEKWHEHEAAGYPNTDCGFETSKASK